ncbi:MAG: peptidase M22 [Hominimerdicola sp.]
MSLVLGIDTSNYTTSTALLDTVSMEVRQCKKLLPVKLGERGIRQSDAVFHHTKQLPEMLCQLIHKGEKPEFIGVSFKPRLADDSYMPCFLVGEGTADSIGAFNNIKPDKTSHQIGHVLAALYSCGRLDLVKGEKHFAAFHVSGGTTDLLLCTPDKDNVLDIVQIGGSRDLKAGQAVDRIGVRLGLQFPCGKELEKLAEKSDERYRIKPSVDGLYCSLSGIENKCNKLIDEGESNENIANFCLSAVFSALYEITKNLRKDYGDIPIVYAGGVMSNKMIKQGFEEMFGGLFAQPEFSCDNAVGTALFSALKRGLI